MTFSTRNEKFSNLTKEKRIDTASQKNYIQYLKNNYFQYFSSFFAMNPAL